MKEKSGEVHFAKVQFDAFKSARIFTPLASGLEGYCRHGPDGRLPDLQNPYLCNLLTDFLHSKFCGIV